MTTLPLTVDEFCRYSMTDAEGGEIVMHARIEWDVQGLFVGFMMNDDDVNISEIVRMQRKNTIIEDAKRCDSVDDGVNLQLEACMR